jgi:hypothetical protein
MNISKLRSAAAAAAMRMGGGGDSQSANEQCRRVCRQQEYKIISSSKIVENEKQDLSRVQNTSGCHSEVYLATSLNALVNNKE